MIVDYCLDKKKDALFFLLNFHTLFIHRMNKAGFPALDLPCTRLREGGGLGGLDQG